MEQLTRRYTPSTIGALPLGLSHYFGTTQNKTDPKRVPQEKAALMFSVCFALLFQNLNLPFIKSLTLPLCQLSIQASSQSPASSIGAPGTGSTQRAGFQKFPASIKERTLGSQGILF